MNMKEAVTSAVFKKYATIEGRASRSEFWWFTLFSVLGGILFDVLDAVLGWQFGEPDIFGNRAGVLNLLFNLAVLVPIVCVTARRLHDVNRSGWWMLIQLMRMEKCMTYMSSRNSQMAFLPRRRSKHSSNQFFVQP